MLQLIFINCHVTAKKFERRRFVNRRIRVSSQAASSLFRLSLELGATITIRRIHFETFMIQMSLKFLSRLPFLVKALVKLIAPFSAPGSRLLSQF